MPQGGSSKPETAKTEQPKPKPADLETIKNKWQVRSTELTILVTLVGLLAGGFKFFSQRTDELKARSLNEERQAENALRESQKPFLQRQLDTCFEVAVAAGTLASENEPGVKIKPEDHAKALASFWLHFHGPLSVVEDARVESAMVAFGDRLRPCERAREKCDLQNEANVLAHACRDLIRTGWGFNDPRYNR